MNARMTCRLWLSTLLITFFAAPVLSESPPELKELDRYLGEWKSTIENQDITASSKTEWIVQGQIVQQKIKYSDGAETLIMRGYSQQDQKYFLTLFDSRGVHWMMTGTWDKPTNPFQFEGRLGESTVKVKSTFRNNNQTEDWTITFLSPDNDVSELRGTNQKVVK
jgi:hypothetical protein